jgi:capsular exopolysaccharide synthesis family protein
MSDYDLNIQDYLRVLRKRRFTIVAIFVAVAAMTWFYVLRLPLVYEARTTVKFSESKSLSGLLTDTVLHKPGDKIDAQVRLIKGFAVLSDVACVLGELSKDSSLEEAYEIVERLQNRLTVRQVSDTNIIEIGTRASDPDRAVLFAKTVASIVVEKDLAEQQEQAGKLIDYIESQMSLLIERISQSEVRTRIIQDDYKDIWMSGSFQEQLSGLEALLVGRLQKYTEKHPLVRQTREQISMVEERMNEFAGKEIEYENLLQQMDNDKQLLASLRKKLEDVRLIEAEKVSNLSVVDPAVRPRLPVGPGRGQTIFIGCLLGLMVAVVFVFVSESLDTSLATIEDVEKVFSLPVLGAVPSIRNRKSILGFLRHYMECCRRKNNHSDCDDVSARLIAHTEPKSMIAEAYRLIRTSLNISPSRRFFLVTSAGPREGKTTVLINLGIVIAQTGARTLLVSSDLRRPAIARTFGLKKSPGLNEVISGEATLDEALRTKPDIMCGDRQLSDTNIDTGIENITILPCGRIPQWPSELLESDRMREVVAELKRRFDVILFDSPPALPIADAALLTAFCDRIVLIYEAGRTSRNALLRVKQQLEARGGQVAGVVLNHISPETEALANYLYYRKYKYYRYYNYNSGEEPYPDGKATCI